MMADSAVLSCGAFECAYNRNKACKAPAVSVGSDHAMCDTFTQSGTPEEQGMPSVAACHSADCQYNESMGCKAPGITVWTHEQHADCATFLPQQ